MKKDSFFNFCVQLISSVLGVIVGGWLIISVLMTWEALWVVAERVIGGY